MYCIIVRFDIKPDFIEEFSGLIKSNAAESIEESGCIQFDAAQTDDSPATFVLYEVYSDKASFEDHLSSDHFKSFSLKTENMIAGKNVEELKLISRNN